MNEYGLVLENVSLKKYFTLGVGPTVKFLVDVYDENKLSLLINYLKNKKMQFFILGNGSNTIMDDKYFKGVVIRLKNFNNIDIKDNVLTCGAGVMLPYLNNYLLLKGYTNFSFASMIPGSVGGSVVGNSGCYNHEIMDYLIDVTVLDKDGSIKTINKKDISFGYRYTSLKDKYIILSARFLLEKGDPNKASEQISIINEKRRNSQPLSEKTVGSVFRNPEGKYAGQLIESLGLKGYTIGGAKISEKHANFIVNFNNASFQDIMDLISLIKQKVKEEYNIDLVLEPNVVTW